MTDGDPFDLHQQRLQHVAEQLRASGARRVLDLGCGTGTLLQYLLQAPQFETLVGLEQSGELLAQAQLRLGDRPEAEPGRLTLVCGSYADPQPHLSGFDAAAMVETLEHVPPASLSRVERAVFGQLRPALLLLTTPNHDYNPLYGLAPGEYRDPDHKFEWTRARFRDWAQGVARRNGYRVRLSGIGEWHPELGQPTQQARFTLPRGEA
ncbi:3' terminal RNA ribose 2'-O-methyltransferase Hen1 [Halomonas campaniensis]|uniref:Small RNA 2'-O-methyltransferase n=1 Tax=Halomonas campaniensis TaxID=213554 RepID=A0A7W5P9A4_9GAMM|nr:class I SAM-dependent methyltransferase [Halomonas campaniensis]MBB3329420.1 3' terminal RNA ribose 2'-O-methyltransferase Hen1 [Halomonas campaniensis]